MAAVSAAAAQADAQGCLHYCLQAAFAGAIWLCPLPALLLSFLHVCRITRQELAEGLEAALVAERLFAPHLLPLAFEKLSSTLRWVL